MRRERGRKEAKNVLRQASALGKWPITRDYRYCPAPRCCKVRATDVSIPTAEKGQASSLNDV